MRTLKWKDNNEKSIHLIVGKTLIRGSLHVGYGSVGQKSRILLLCLISRFIIFYMCQRKIWVCFGPLTWRAIRYVIDKLKIKFWWRLGNGWVSFGLTTSMIRGCGLKGSACSNLGYHLVSHWCLVRFWLRLVETIHVDSDPSKIQLNMK